ncbi:MAG: T9SS type A sorting domain-containing protein [Bacteroidetes bacterium]|nr:T9SS type A sorting domain-containing protein [Bacteroidota bacterium]
MKGKIYLTAIIVLLSSLTILAQTPTVLTLKANGGSSTETPEGSSHISISAKLNGAVNANGTNCTLSFEYGLTTSYGNTVSASPGTVTGNADNAVTQSVTLNYTAIGLEERKIHYRLKVTNEYGTYYGRDFIATAIDPTRNIFISATCTDSQTWANFDMLNNNSFDITLNYSAGASYTGSVIIGSYQVQQVFVGKGSICSFSYHFTLFRQVFTNDQLCSETQLPCRKDMRVSIGKIASDKMMYRIENVNSSSVNIEITCGSSIYPYTIAPQSVAYFAGPLAEAQIGISGEPFAISSPSGGYAYEGMAWLSVTPLSTTATTANFELYNRDDATHTFVMRNAGGTENSYTLAAYESRTVTLSNENWDVYTTVWDPTGMRFGPQYNNIYTGPAFGDATSFYNGLLKVATAIPGSSIVPNVASSSVTSSTSITLNGTITNNAFTAGSVDYYFVYGTDPGNLNQSTATQNISVSAQSSVNVNATLTGLTAETMYYFKLAAATNQSSGKKIFLSTAIPTTNLKLHLRSDLAVTSSGSAVSTWGDVSGFDNDASQSTSANQPTLVSNSMNGNPVIRFNGTNSKLTLPTSATLGIQSNPYEMFVVGKSSSNNVQFLIAGGYENFEYHLNGASGTRFIPVNSTFIDIGSAGNYTDGNAHIFSARASSSGGAVRVDGTDGGTSVSNILSSNSGNLLLGVRSDGTYYLNGDIAEVILYNTNLSTSDRSTVEHYLANRYGITSSALPVELTSFTASAVDGKVLLNWQTATEVNNYGFAVERSSAETRHASSLQWEKVSFVQGHGNSNSPKSYSYTDNLARLAFSNARQALAHDLNLDHLQYRLKQIDFDGKYEYSNVVEVNIETPARFALEQNYPNPFNPTTTIKYSIPASPSPSQGEGLRVRSVTMKVYDMLGREVAILVNEQKTPGNYEVKFDGTLLSSGVYLYKLEYGGLSQTRKLLLIK